MLQLDKFIKKTKKEFYEIAEDDGWIFDNLWGFVEKKIRESGINKFDKLP